MYVSRLKNVCLLISCLTVASINGAKLDGIEVEPRIIGGAVAEKNYPFMASLLANSRYGHLHICGGSIINERTILTAAHCLSNLIPATLKVHVGDKLRELKEGKVYDVQDIYSHDQFNSTTHDYDVGLIRIMGFIEFGANTQPIKLARPRDKIRPGSYATVLGWGFTDLRNRTLANELMVANVPIVKQTTCNRQMDGSITSRMLCAGFKNGVVDSCTYDSGGPLIANNKQIGIVSWGYGCAQPNKPGIYVRVSVLLPWIENILLKQYYEILV